MRTTQVQDGSAPAAARVCLDGLDADALAGVARDVLDRLDAQGRQTVARAALAGLDDRSAQVEALAHAAVGRLGTHALIDVARSTVRGLGSDPLTPGMVDDDALAASVTAIDRLERMVHGEKLRRISVLDDRRAHQGRARVTADWLAPALGLSAGEAKAHTDTAQALRRLPATAQRLRDGELGVGQARQAAASLAELDRTAEDGTADAAAAKRLDAHVAQRGPSQTRAQLRTSIDRLHHDHDPDVLAQRQRRARARRNAWITTGTDGDVRFGGALDALAGAALTAAVNALARPTGHDDARTPAQRRADAFTELARRQLDHGDLPTMAAHHPHVIVVTNHDALDDLPGAQASWLDGYGPVSSATARMVACDGRISEVVVDQHGRPLKVKENGRPTRKQRRAVIARDRGCVGCGAPASACQLHHIIWRRHKGATIVDNLVLVCWACHHSIHHDGWTVHRTASGYTIHRPQPDTGPNTRPQPDTDPNTHPPPHPDTHPPPEQSPRPHATPETDDDHDLGLAHTA